MHLLKAIIPLSIRLLSLIEPRNDFPQSHSSVQSEVRAGSAASAAQSLSGLPSRCRPVSDLEAWTVLPGSFRPTAGFRSSKQQDCGLCFPVGHSQLLEASLQDLTQVSSVFKVGKGTSSPSHASNP